jgi:amidase
MVEIAVDDFAFAEATVEQLQAAMATGQTTATELTSAYTKRIRDIDSDGPRLRSVIELNPDAIAIAAALDVERAKTGPRGPLHGIPILIKDNIATGDRMQTTAGSMALFDRRPNNDAFVVQRLRDAGAVILGKTNLSEWANIRSTRSTSGWSGRGGLTRNPYSLDRNAGGSSSGSGAAIAANLCAVAVGTETDGSIVLPSALNGIVGLKPTVGLISRHGIIPISHSQDTAGPMTRTVADAAALLTVLGGPDPRDPATADAPTLDYTANLDIGRLRGARLGVVRDNPPRNPELQAVFDDAVRKLRDLGAVVIDPVEMSPAPDLEEAEITVFLYELRHGLRAWFSEFTPHSPIATIDDVIAWNTAHAETELTWFGQEFFERAAALGELTDPLYVDALAVCRAYANTSGVNRALATHSLDALIEPTNGPAWVTDLVNGDNYTGGSSTPAAVCGTPSITVPMGMVRGLPVGLSFLGAAWSEPLLIGLAYAYEQATLARRPPTFPPSVP